MSSTGQRKPGWGEFGIPSVRRLRFFNETDRPTFEAEGASHILLWHSPAASRPPRDSAHLGGTHDEAVLGHDALRFEVPVLKDEDTLAVRCRFRIEGHELVDVWTVIPDANAGNFIIAYFVLVEDAPKDMLRVTTWVHYWDEAAGTRVSSDLVAEDFE